MENTTNKTLIATENKIERKIISYKEDNDEEIDDEYRISSSDEIEEPIKKDNVFEINKWNNEKSKEWWIERKKKFINNADSTVLDKKQVLNKYKLLLNLSPFFLKFVKPLGQSDKTIYKLCQSFEQKFKKQSNKKHQRKTERQEDKDLLESDNEKELENNNNEEEANDEFYLEEKIAEEVLDHEVNGFFTETPNFIQGTSLRDYQIKGLNWMIQLHTTNLSGILADEMGLGKTLQSVSFLGYLRFVLNIEGPFLVIAPKSTLQNWEREFNKWTPEVKTLILQGNKDYRNHLIHDSLYGCKFDVIITSYEILMKEKNALKRFAWEYIVIDEAHRIKNEQSLFSQTIRTFKTKNRLLVTGTPLQNNLHELWALLNFILPDIFKDAEVFDEEFGHHEENNESTDQDVVKQLHSILSPFVLRRVKIDVEKALLPKIETNLYVGMTEMQKKWYKSLLTKDLDALNGSVAKSESKTRLLNIVMQLRKCCNHPYLFDGAEPGPPFTTDEHLVENSAKMIILDKLLKLKKQQGSRVLIFSQMSRQLDILEDFCFLRDYNYCRIDGQTEHEDRIKAIDDYNEPNSDKFIFLLTTRAGGLGINLVTADTVVIYDSDWNPQADLQAMDRAHRIGQKKQVYVYRFITENAIEEKILERAKQKLRLDQLVIQQGLRNNSQQEKIGKSKDDLLNMIQYGADDMFSDQNTAITSENLDIDEILKKGAQKTQELNAKYETLGLQDLQKFNGMGDQSAYEWNGENFQKKNVQSGGFEKYAFERTRERKKRSDINYSEDGQFKEKTDQQNTDNAENNIDYKIPKYPPLLDFQFFPKQIHDLYEKEMLYYRKMSKFKVTKDYIKQKYGQEDDNDDDELNSSMDYEGEESSDDDKEENEEEEDEPKKTSSKDEQENFDGKSDKNSSDFTVPLDSYYIDGKYVTEKQLVEREQTAIENSSEFTKEDKALKEQLLSKGFTNWSKREFSLLMQLVAKYGRESYTEISKGLQSKSEEEIELYLRVFFEKYEEIEHYEKILGKIEDQENKRFEKQKKYDAFKQFMASIINNNPLINMNIPYMPNTSKKTFNEIEDRFLLITLYENGGLPETPEMNLILKKAVMTCPLFEFDWFIRTRSDTELGRRVGTLLQVIQKHISTSSGKRQLTTEEDGDESILEPKKVKL
ncbi:hypothetical protein QEN19_003660 [Hanseniaspora menglaensis]